MKKFLSYFALFVLILVVAFFGLKDMIIQKVLQKHLSESMKTNVRIYGVDYFVFKEKLLLKGIGVESLVNSSLDSIYIESIETNLKLSELINKKLFIESINIKNIELNKETDRENTISTEVSQTVAVSDDNLSAEEISNLRDSLANNYQTLVQYVNAEDLQKFHQGKIVFLEVIRPFLGNYIDGEIANITTEYLNEILDSYQALKIGTEQDRANLFNALWSLEIDSINIETDLYNRTFSGSIEDFSTDKNKINENISFALNSQMENEVGTISGEINLIKLEGFVNTKLENLIVTSLVDTKNFFDSNISLNQEIVFSEDKINIDGEIKLDEILFDKELVSEYFLKDKNAIDVIIGDTKPNVRDIELDYKYTTAAGKATIKSNIADEVIIYLGGSESQLDKLKQMFDDKFGDDIDKLKDSAKSKLNDFFKKF